MYSGYEEGTVSLTAPSSMICLSFDSALNLYFEYIIYDNHFKKSNKEKVLNLGYGVYF